VAGKSTSYSNVPRETLRAFHIQVQKDFCLENQLYIFLRATSESNLIAHDFEQLESGFGAFHKIVTIPYWEGNRTVIDL